MLAKALAGILPSMDTEEQIEAALKKAAATPPIATPLEKPGAVGEAASYICRAIESDKYCHIKGKAYQVNNLTHHICFIDKGISFYCPDNFSERMCNAFGFSFSFKKSIHIIWRIFFCFISRPDN